MNGLMPVLYESIDRVSRELIGMIPSVTMDMGASQVAKGQQVLIPVTPYDANNEDVVPSSSNDISEDGDEIGNVAMTISKVRRAKPIVWSGEEQLSVNGVVNQIMVDQFTQRMRSLVNEMEKDICFEATHGAALAGNIVGKACVNPFETDLKPLAKVLKVLKDRGAPTEELQAVINTETGMNMRSLTKLTNVDNAGSDDLLRRGILTQLYGFSFRESAGFEPFKKGTASGYLVNGGANAGDTEVTVDTGSGTLNAGDIVTFGTDETQYVVAEAVATGGTTIKLASPLLKDVADNAAVNVGDDYLPNACFSRGSIILMTRLPAVPKNGDSAIDRTVITDPVSGLSFEVALWGGKYKNEVTVAAAWGTKNIKPEHTVALIG